MNCSFCRQNNPQGEAFCRKCGASLQGGTNAPSTAQANQAQQQGQQPTQSQNAGSGLKDCPNCGSVSSGKALLCQNCGHAFGQTTTNSGQQANRNAGNAGFSKKLFTPKDWSQDSFCVCCGNKKDPNNMACLNNNCLHKQSGFANMHEWNQAHVEHQTADHQLVTSSQSQVEPLSVEMIVNKFSITEGESIEVNWKITGGGRITSRELTLPNGQTVAVGKVGPYIHTPTIGSVEYVITVTDENHTDNDRKIILVSPSASQQQPILYNICPNCRHSTQGARKFCMNCGRNLTQ